MHIRGIFSIYGAYTGLFLHIRSIYGAFFPYTEHIRAFFCIYGAYTGHFLHIRSIYGAFFCIYGAYEYRTKLGMTKVVLRGSWGYHHCKTDRGPP